MWRAPVRGAVRIEIAHTGGIGWAACMLTHTGCRHISKAEPGERSHNLALPDLLNLIFGSRGHSIDPPDPRHNGTNAMKTQSIAPERRPYS